MKTAAKALRQRLRQCVVFSRRECGREGQYSLESPFHSRSDSLWRCLYPEFRDRMQTVTAGNLLPRNRLLRAAFTAGSAGIN